MPANYYSFPGTLKRSRSLKTKNKFKPSVPVATVTNVVCNHFNTPFDKVNSDSRKHPLPYIRHIIMLFLYEFSVPSLKLAGEVFNRDHTTVMSGLQTLNDLMDTEEKVKAEVEYLRGQVLSVN